MWNVECELWNVELGVCRYEMWDAECGMWNVKETGRWKLDVVPVWVAFQNSQYSFFPIGDATKKLKTPVPKVTWVDESK